MRLRRRIGVRVAALVLASAIGADAALDATCDPLLPRGSAAVAVTGGGDHSAGTDACDAVCVPDCYCCSSSEAVGSAVTIPPPALVAVALEPPLTAIQPVARLVLEPPPLALS